MWKIGPECAAQQAKNVSPRTRNWGERSACAAEMPVGAPDAEPPLAIAGPGGRLTSSAAGGGAGWPAHAQGGGQEQRPGKYGDRQQGGAQVVGRDQQARKGREGHGPHAETRRDKRDGETEVLLAPRRG